MRAKILLAIILVATSVRPSLAQTYGPFSAWQLDASLPLQYGTNSLLVPINSQSDIFVSPNLKLSALGDLDPTTSFSIYASGGPDAFAQVRTADDGLATIGGRIQKAFGNFGVGAIYEHSLIYDGIFRTLLFQANDFSAFAGYKYVGPSGLTISPSVMVTYREADLASAERVLFTLKAAITQSLTKDLTFFLTPRLRYYDFTNGASSGRRDTRPSVISGVTYQLNPDVGVTGSVEYDQRWSNTAGRNFTNTVFLVSLDFSHQYKP